MGEKIRIYLDSCCYNRPYDGQQQLKIQLETGAKLFIQSLVKLGAVELTASFVLKEEISASPDEEKLQAIMNFIDDKFSIFVGAEHIKTLLPIVSEIMASGVKAKDATHVSCAILAKCDYFISTDIRLLKYQSDKIKLLNPIDFVKLW